MKFKILKALILVLIMSVMPVMSIVATGASSIDVIESREVDHAEYLRSELARYDGSSSYFEKYGISIKLREYISENKLDKTDPQIAELVSINEAHITELLSGADEYDLLLVENAEIFLEKCEDLRLAEGYLAISKVLEETEYYFFNMDVSVYGVDEGIKLYDAKLLEIFDMEKKAEVFISEVDKLLFAGDDDNLLELIINASSAFALVDADIEGVADACDTMKIFMDAYDSSVEEKNNELSATRKTVGYIRNFEGSESFVTLILETIG